MMHLKALFLCVVTAMMAQAAGPVLVLIGPPASGKTTQTGLLSKELKIPVISADELIAGNAGQLSNAKSPTIQGMEPRVDPAMNRLIEDKLRSMDLSNGVILDGYPAAKIQGDHLTSLVRELSLPKPVIIHLKVPDDVVKKRLKGEPPAGVEQRLKDYHRELDFVRVYFPEADIHDVDGTGKRGSIAKEIRKIVQAKGKS